MISERKIIPLFKVAIHPQAEKFISQVLCSGWIGEGPRVKEFEKALALQFNNPYCLALNSGTGGLRLALELIATKNRGKGGGKVITTPLTCFATVAPILTRGWDIVWADVQKESLNIDPGSIREKIDKDVSAILVVHWGGYPCDMEEIKEISAEYNIPVIEDAAHTYKAKYKDSIIGDCEYSDFCMISLQAIKFLTSGDGGLLFAKNKEDYEKGKLLRWFGINRESNRKDLRCEDDISQAGFKLHMNDISAAIGIANLDLVSAHLEATRENAFFYRKNLKDISGITLLQDEQDRTSSNWLFTILVDDLIGFSRKMGESGIMVSKVHARIDKHSCVGKYKDNLPNLDYVDCKRICIPSGWWITKGDREYIVDVIKKGW